MRPFGQDRAQRQAGQAARTENGGREQCHGYVAVFGLNDQLGQNTILLGRNNQTPRSVPIILRVAAGLNRRHLTPQRSRGRKPIGCSPPHEVVVARWKPLQKPFFHRHAIGVSLKRDRSESPHNGNARIAHVITEALFNGPQEGLIPTVPPGTELRGLFVTDDGIAHVDISETVTTHHPGGAKTELLTIYSIVNSLVLNIPEIDAVKILIGGREAMTLAGHIDLRFPLKANMLLVR